MRHPLAPDAVALNGRSEVRPGAEAGASAGDDDAAHLGAAAHLADGLHEGVEQIRGHAVSIVGSIQCDDSDGIIDLEENWVCLGAHDGKSGTSGQPGPRFLGPEIPACRGFT